MNSDSAKLTAKKDYLEKLVKENDRIFIDTCTLMANQNDNAVESFWQNITPFLKKYQKVIIIPKSVVDELLKHANTSQDKNLALRAKNAVNLIKKLHENRIINIFGDKSDNTHADNVFDTIFTQFRIKYTMLLITRDYNLAQDILALNNKKATNGKRVEAQIVSNDGFLLHPNIISKQKFANSTQTNNQKSVQPFMIGVQITDISNEVLPTHFIPKIGDYVMTPSGTQIKLTNKIAEGGEGAAFETSTEYVAKIYFKERITKRIYEKIKLMVTRQVKFKGICFPIDMLFNAHNEFVGYLMPKAKGHNLQKIMFSKPLLEKYFPNFKKRDMIEICITILEKITFLHSLNVILGDINPQNILVVSPKEVYFVDTDSYQIGGFPCPVGTINFTAPEIQGKNYATFLRTMGNDKFAVATLLFMIMLPGKPPYSQQGGESPAQNIKNGNFPYAFENKTNKKAPDGSWKFMWSHLNFKVKEAFYHTFQKGGNHNDKTNRISSEKWLELFKGYHRALDNMAKTDEMANDIFPSRPKKLQGREYIKCKLCGKEADKENGQMEGICKDCLYSETKAEIYKCADCGMPIIYNNFKKYVKKMPKPKTCYNCFKKSRRY